MSPATTKPKTSSKAPKAKKAAAPEAAETNTASVAAAPEGLRRKMLVGTVISDKMQKTIVVRVDRRVRHPFYKKFVTRTIKFKAHDEKNTAKIGDQVQILESRPLSKEKRWVLRSILRKAIIQAVDNEI